MPFTTQMPSYLKWMHLPHYRLPGLGTVERNDVVVFNFPEGDTVLYARPASSYYALARGQAQAEKAKDPAKRSLSFWEGQVKRGFINRLDYTVRPVDKRENYIKRCVGVPDDEIKIENGVLFVNGEKAMLPELHQFDYKVGTTTGLRPEYLKTTYDVNLEDTQVKTRRSTVTSPRISANMAQIPLSRGMAEKIEQDNLVTGVEYDFHQPGVPGANNDPLAIFPNTPGYDWNRDNFGPLTVPKKGTTVALNIKELPKYRRIIDIYEENDLEVKDGKIIINGEEADSYTFKMDYYFMMGDNRHNSADSRFWGFVPEDHVVGKALFVWFSYDKELSWSDGKLRLDRFFSGID